MAKGKGKGKGKGKKKDLQEVEPPVGKEFYEDQIAELNRTLAELRTRTYDLEARNVELVQKYDQLVTDREDVVFYLNKLIHLRVEEVHNFKKIMTEIEELQQHDQDEFDKELVQLEEEFTQMREQLSGEFKQIEGRIAAMEEYRIEKDELLRKFQIQEEILEEQEERHKRVMYNTEKKFVLDKEAFSKDMKDRVNKLAFDFEDKNELRIAAATQRLVKENIAANKIINMHLTKNDQLENENETLSLYFNKLREEFRVCKTQYNAVTNNTRKQNERINDLRKRIHKLNIKLENYADLIEKGNKNKTQLRNLTKRAKDLEDKIRILHQNIHATRCKQVKLSGKVNETFNEIKIYQEIIHEVKICTKYLDHLHTLDMSHEERVEKRNIIYDGLLNVITGSMREAIEAKQMRITLKDSVLYTRGDLGLMPKVHQETAISMIYNAISQVGKSLESLVKTQSEISSSTLSMPMMGESLEEEELTSTTIEEESTEFVPDNASDDDEQKASIEEKRPSRQTLMASDVALKEIMGEGYEAMGEHLKLLEGIGAVAYGDLVYAEDYE